MAYALVSHTGFAGSVSGGSTSFIDTTGATLLIVHVSQYGGEPAYAPTDNFSNDWYQLTSQVDNNDPRSTIFYAKNPTVGVDQYVTVTGTFAFPTVCFAAFSGANTTSPFDVENGGMASSVTSINTGSVTPNENGELIIAGLSVGAVETGSIAIDSGFTILDTADYGAGDHLGGSAAYLVQGSSGAVNPQWTWAGTARACATIATFKSSAVAQELNPTLYRKINGLMQPVKYGLGA